MKINLLGYISVLFSFPFHLLHIPSLFSYFPAILLSSYHLDLSFSFQIMCSHIVVGQNVTTQIVLLFCPGAYSLCDTVCTPSFGRSPLFGTFPSLSICSGTSDTVRKPQISWIVLVIIVDVALIITSGVETEKSKCSPCGPAWPDLTQFRAAVAWLLWLQNIAC